MPVGCSAGKDSTLVGLSMPRQLAFSVRMPASSARFRRAKVYVDCNSFGPRAIEAGVRLYGAERIVCGTDGTAFGVDWTLKAIADADIGDEAREKILRGNAAALLARGAALAQREKAAA